MAVRQQPSTQLIELDRAECLELLASHKVGRVAVTIDGQPHIVPVNYAADPAGNVTFRTGPDTVLVKVDLERVAFEIDGIDEPRRCGWSVCVHGVGREITAADAADTSHRGGPTPWAPGPRPRWFVIHPREVTGRRLTAAPTVDVEWFPGIPWS
jgi:nitroimidazol reductase NimA-like FMN-containing flavoprotein (pyridoxamine 5'-phosphate oxidase superfamily)